jgi:MFS family permease
VSDPSVGLPSGRRWWTLVATGSATALVWTNAQDLSVALPEIARELPASLDELQWTITAFMLAGGALILATGRLADIYGRRLLFLGGIALLSLASIPAALADDSGMLIAARALMGIGGALVLPASLAIVSTTFRG